MHVTDDDFDFDAYLQGPDEGAMVRSASDWMDAVIESFERPNELQGAFLPWSKTHNIIRLRRGELSIWPGTNGSGKSMMIGQVALHLLQQGERVCIASMEMKPREVLRRMCRQALGSSAPDRQSLREFDTWARSRLFLYDQQGAVSPDRIIALARYCHERLAVDHLVVDNLLACGIPEDGNGALTAQKQFILSLACHAHDSGQAVHLLAHTRKTDESKPPSKFDVRGSGTITDLADNVFSIWRNKPKEAAQESGDHSKDDEEDASLTVCKHRHGEWEGRIRLWFDRRSLTYLQSPTEQPMAMRLLAADEMVEF